MNEAKSCAQLMIENFEITSNETIGSFSLSAGYNKVTISNYALGEAKFIGVVTDGLVVDTLFISPYPGYLIIIIIEQVSYF
jgi:hypothetical protein